jgi:GWxTD domain-containing protein
LLNNHELPAGSRLKDRGPVLFLGRLCFRRIILLTKRTILIALAGLVLIAPQAFAQPEQDPQKKPRNVKREPNNEFKKWIEEVGPILTDEERRAWDKLQTNEEREQFIATVWRLRDPSPDTEENEYREAYFERFAYVNEHFASGIPGWKTDRGRIYIAHGKPDSIESHLARHIRQAFLRRRFDFNLSVRKVVVSSHSESHRRRNRVHRSFRYRRVPHCAQPI